MIYCGWLGHCKQCKVVFCVPFITTKGCKMRAPAHLRCEPSHQPLISHLAFMRTIALTEASVFHSNALVFKCLPWKWRQFWLTLSLGHWCTSLSIDWFRAGYRMLFLVVWLMCDSVRRAHSAHDVVITIISRFLRIRALLSVVVIYTGTHDDRKTIVWCNK